MKAHVVGSGIAGMAAAAYLIRDGGMLPGDITIYEAGHDIGGAMCAGGGPETGYVLPTGRLLERECRCAFDLFSFVPSATDPAVSIKDHILAFNTRHPFDARARIVGRNGIASPQPHFGLNLRNRLKLARLAMTPETTLDGRRIDEFFGRDFFQTEFWTIWTTMMGSLPQHSLSEMRRFVNRFLHLLPDLSTMKHIMRTPFNQKETIADPLSRWLRDRGVAFLPRSPVTRVALSDTADRITATALEYTHADKHVRVELAADDVVLVTIGSQAADLAIGSDTEPPRMRLGGASWSVWRELAQDREGLGRPEVFFGPQNVADSKWVTFTVTTQDPTFFALMRELTGNEPGTGGLTTLKDSSWLITLSIFHQPEFIDQPEGTQVWWGFIIRPDRAGDFVGKPAAECSGEEVLRETLHHLSFGSQAEAIVTRSTCIPCVLPFADNVWTVRRRGDRPPVVPEGSTNLGFLGQYAETPHDAAFMMEYSVRTAREAVATLLKLERRPPPPYRGQFDPSALYGALKAMGVVPSLRMPTRPGQPRGP